MCFCDALILESDAVNPQSLFIEPTRRGEDVAGTYRQLGREMEVEMEDFDLEHK